jgi:hypothetical protein
LVACLVVLKRSSLGEMMHLDQAGIARRAVSDRDPDASRCGKAALDGIRLSARGAAGLIDGWVGSG